MDRPWRITVITVAFWQCQCFRFSVLYHHPSLSVEKALVYSPSQMYKEEEYRAVGGVCVYNTHVRTHREQTHVYRIYSRLHIQPEHVYLSLAIVVTGCHTRCTSSQQRRSFALIWFQQEVEDMYTHFILSSVYELI